MVKKFYIKDKKKFRLLIIILSVIVFFTMNVVLMSIFGIATVAAYGLTLTLVVGVIGFLIGLLVLIVVVLYYLIKDSIGKK